MAIRVSINLSCAYFPMKKALFLIALAATAAFTSSAMADATIRPGDTFELRIGGVPPDDQGAIGSNYVADGEGNINLPYVGKIHIANLTISAVQAVIERAYISGGIFTHPTVTVNPATSARFVNVAGQVKAPGRIPYTADMTIISAINAAGDFNEFANQKKVHLTREGKVEFENCARARVRPDEDKKVLPGDQIFVEESFF